MRKILIVFLGLSLVGLGILIGLNFSEEVSSVVVEDVNKETSNDSQNDTERLKVTKVVDGDTIVLSNGQTLRYIGIDTPERGDCFFEEAKLANEKLVQNAEVRLEKDVSETDKYGRLLRYIWVIGGIREISKAWPSGLGEIMVNEELVKNGYAQVSTYPPDVRYQGKFLTAQKEAREEKLGVWGDGVCSNRTNGSNLPNETNVPGTGEAEKPSLTSSKDKDCGDFKTHQEAQDFFVANGGSTTNDPHKLDSDGDGVACESLP